MLANKIQIGDIAPDFELPSQDGKTVRLSDFRGRNIIVLYFYPEDGHKICVTEACVFRDKFSEFKQSDAKIIGVSSDNVRSHHSFAEKYCLPYLLLSDEDNKVRLSFGLPKTKWLLSARKTIVINKEGIVKCVLQSEYDSTKHIDEVVRVLKKINWEENEK